MLKRKIVTAALMTVGVFVSLEYISLAQSNQTTPTPSPTTTTPGGTTTTPSPTTTTPGGTITPPSPTITTPGGTTTTPSPTITTPGGTTTTPSPTTTTPTPGATGQSGNKLSAVDQQFMTQAAQGGMAEVKLGQMAQKRAASNSVKQYAQRMIKEHTQANKELMQIAAKKGVTLPKNVNEQQQALMNKLSKLSGKRFDQVYMEEAGVKSHAQQEALYQREVEQGQDPEVKAFAAKTLPVVQAHLQAARTLTGKKTGTNANPQGSTR